MKIELDTPTIARERPEDLDAGQGDASQARHQLVAPRVVVRWRERWSRW